MEKTPTRTGKATRARAHTDAKQPNLGVANARVPHGTPEEPPRKRARQHAVVPAVQAGLSAASGAFQAPVQAASATSGLVKSLVQRARRSLCRQTDIAGPRAPALRPGGLLEAMRRRGTLPVATVVATPATQPRMATPAVASSSSARPAEATPAAPRERRTQPRPQQLLRSATVTISDHAAARLNQPPATGVTTPPGLKQSPHRPPPLIPKSPTCIAGKKQPASQARHPLPGTIDLTPPSTKSRKRLGTDGNMADHASAHTPRGATAAHKSPVGGIKAQLPQSSPRNTRPPVPAFSASASQTAARSRKESEPWLKLREIKLPPPKPEDNYELSDKEEESDAEEPDRSHKPVPMWSAKYLELIEKQADIDPDTIFGRRVPKCDLLAVFSDDLYKGCNKERPKRKRGSSGEWRQDRLTTQEVGEYKKKMGHAKSWMTNEENQDSNIQLHVAVKN